MKRYLATLLILLNSISAFGANDLASRICEPGTKVIRLVSDWKKEEKIPGDYKQPNEVCAAAICKNDKHEFERTKCIREQEEGRENTVIISYTAWITEANLSKSMARAHRFIINKEDQCFDACKPEKKMFKTISGLERKSCMECFKNRDSTVDENINYPEIGKVLLKGTKCHELCKDREGPIVSERVLSTQCQQCVGINGFQPEQFQYLITKAGNCMEFDKDLKRYVVDAELCRKAPELIHTVYEEAKTWQAWISGGETHCTEIDEKTWGQIYKVHSLKSNCDSLKINNADRNSSTDKSTEKKNGAASSPGSSKQ